MEGDALDTAVRDLTTNWTLPVWQCPVAEACLGSEAGRLPACAEGFAGPLCNLCDVGWSRAGPLELLADQPCTPCADDSSWVLDLLATLVVLIVPPAALYLASSPDVASARDLRIQVFARQLFIYVAVLALRHSYRLPNMPKLESTLWPKRRTPSNVDLLGICLLTGRRFKNGAAPSAPRP